MIRSLLAVLAIFMLLVPAARADAFDRAIDDALAAYEQVYPQLAEDEFGVDTAAYRDALSLGRFQSDHWGGAFRLVTERAGDTGGACARFAAFVRTPPAEGALRLVACPQLFAEGTAELRRLTVLHELVHVVAGPDECRAMAFAARIEALATGSFTPVDRYWSANGCAAAGYRLP